MGQKLRMTRGLFFSKGVAECAFQHRQRDCSLLSERNVSEFSCNQVRGIVTLRSLFMMFLVFYYDESWQHVFAFLLITCTRPRLLWEVPARYSCCLHQT